MTTFIKRLGWVVLTAIVVLFPATIFTQQGIVAPLWYSFLAGIAGALGAGLVPIFFGAIVLVAARGKSDGQLKAALVTTAIASAFVSYLLLYPTLRS